MFSKPFEEYQHRRQVILNHTLVPSDQKDIEIPINLERLDLPDGDVQFADDAHNPIASEIGSVFAHVVIPHLSSSVDTKIWVYCGKERLAK